MKVFENQIGGKNRVNFVDSNNLFFGFATDLECCEEFGFYLSAKWDSNPAHKKQEIELLRSKLSDVNFAQSIFRGADFICFRLSNGLYLYAFNVHNGFYCHGFYTRGFAKDVKGEI